MRDDDMQKNIVLDVDSRSNSKWYYPVNNGSGLQKQLKLTYKDPDTCDMIYFTR